MADDNNDADEWLYGASGEGESGEQQEEHKQEEVEVEVVAAAEKNNTTFEAFDEHNFEEAAGLNDDQLNTENLKDRNEESNQGGADEDDSDDDDDDDDDDINVVIGDIKAGGPSAYVKGSQDPKQKQPGSKFNIEEFESVGTIAGQPAFEFAIENIEDKPWRKPGADITDYFNYGFNEETWRAYCERQKRMRIHESGVGLASLTAAQNPGGMPMLPNSHDSIRPHNIHIGIKRMGGIRPQKPVTIDVIGAPSQNPIRPPAPRENIIQVMTADRREYSRTVQNQPIPMQFNVPPEDFYNHEEQDAFNYGYEPTQDSQWEGNQGWTPSEIKELTPMNQPPPSQLNQPNIGPMHGPPMNNISIPPPGMMGNMPPTRMQMMPPQNMIPPLMGPMSSSMQIKQEPDDKRDMRRMGGRDFRDDRRHDDRKRMRERSTSRDREMRKSERTREERPRSERDRYSRESSSRRRSKSRERNKRSRSRDKLKRSRSRDRKTDEKEGRTRSDKTKRERSKKEES